MIARTATGADPRADCDPSGVIPLPWFLVRMSFSIPVRVLVRVVITKDERRDVTGEACEDEDGVESVEEDRVAITLVFVFVVAVLAPVAICRCVRVDFGCGRTVVDVRAVWGGVGVGVELASGRLVGEHLSIVKEEEEEEIDEDDGTRAVCEPDGMLGDDKMDVEVVAVVPTRARRPFNFAKSSFTFLTSACSSLFSWRRRMSSER